MKSAWPAVIAASIGLLLCPSSAPGKEEKREPITIRFDMPDDGYVTLEIEDAGGGRVRNLVAEKRCKAGENIVAWDGLDEQGQPVKPPSSDKS
jgi:hypothetical protein